MAVCAGITYNGTKLRIQYDGADLDKGSYSAFNDPYRLQDVYDTDQANGWGVFVKVGDYYKLTGGANMEISGANTYVYLYREILELDSNVTNNLYALSWGYIYADLTTFKCHINKYFTFSNGKASLNNCCFVTYRAYVRIEGKDSNNKVQMNGCSYINIYAVYAYDFSELNGCSFQNCVYPIQPSFGAIIANPFINNSTYVFFSQILQGTNGFITISNIRAINSAKRIFIGLVGTGTVNLVDCDIDYTYYNLFSGTGELHFYYKTTMNVKVKNGTGATLNITDKDGNQVYQEVLTSEDMTEQQIAYAHHHVKATGGVFDTDDLEVLQPFTVTVTKVQYDDLVLSQISVNLGHKTDLFGEMIPISYVDRAITGQVHNVTAMTGVVQDLTALTGTISEA